VTDRIYDGDPDLHVEAEAARKRYSRSNGSVGDWREVELVRFADMQPRLDGRPLVKGYLEREQLSLFLGEAGCGKTFLVLDLGLHVAAGRDWFCRKVAQGAVVFVAAEAGRSIVNRVAAWRMDCGFDGKDIPFAVVTSPIDLCHANTDDVDRLIASIQRAKLGPLALLVIDTVSRALAGGNENAPDDMGALVRSADRLRDALGCHVALVHHTGKERSKGSRGHSLLHCAVDSEIEVVRDPTTGISTAHVTKQRDGATDGQIAFRLRQIELGRNQDGDPVTSCVVEPSEKPAQPQSSKIRMSHATARALGLLRDAIARAGETPLASDHIPANTQCVAEDLWRKYCYAGQITNSNKPDARQKAFKRAAETLVAAGHVGKWQSWVWIVRP
jgi:KaiC/GvpD/RAD55 family RecA-like ATPase